MLCVLRTKCPSEMAISEIIVLGGHFFGPHEENGLSIKLLSDVF